MQIVEECLKHAKLIEKLFYILIENTSDFSNYDNLYKQCIFSLSSLKKILETEKLKVQQKQRIVHAIGTVESIRIKLNDFIKQGSGISISSKNNALKKVKWVNIESAFKNRMATSVIVNIKHIDLKFFLKDSAIIFNHHMKKILKNNEALKVNTILKCKFRKNEHEND